MIIVDTNILCRFIRRDDEILHQKACDIILNNEIFLDQVVIAETIWVLIKHYQMDRLAVATTLYQLVDSETVISSSKKMILHSLQLFSDTNFSFIDCWIMSLHEDSGMKVETFDVNLAKKCL